MLMDKRGMCMPVGVHQRTIDDDLVECKVDRHLSLQPSTTPVRSTFNSEFRARARTGSGRRSVTSTFCQQRGGTDWKWQNANDQLEAKWAATIRMS